MAEKVATGTASGLGLLKKEPGSTPMYRKSLISMPTFDGKLLRTVIETPKGNRNKYDYDPDFGCFAFAKALPEGMNFPLDFGFVPSTLGDDGDPLDILVLMEPRPGWGPS